AGTPGLTFDETAARYAALANSLVNAVDLNTPSVDAVVMPGELVTTRTATNVTGHRLSYRVATTAQPGSSITVEPRAFSVRPGGAVTLHITIKSTNAGGQEFGSIVLTPRRGDGPPLHLPVAFVPQQGSVALTSSCAPAQIRAILDPSTCTITATNNSTAPTAVNLQSTLSRNLFVDRVATGQAHGRREVDLSTTLDGRHAGTPSIAPGPTPAGYLPLDPVGTAPIPLRDE